MFAPRQLTKGQRTAALKGWLAGFIGVCALLVPALASAQSTCNVSAQTHAFGAYDTINPSAATSTITVTCSKTQSGPVAFAYTIALSAGPGSYAARQMTGTGDTLAYSLYTTAANTTVWGDGTSGTATVSGSFNVPGGGPGSRFQDHTVHGLIAGSQNVNVGAYSTAAPITVTVTGTAAGSSFPTTTTTFNATASVAAQCNVSAGNHAFGAVNPLSSQVDATSTITVYCTKNAPFTVGLDAGVTAGATIAQRLMANGPDTMLYNLYTNAARSIIWGNSSGSWVSGTGAGLAIAQSLTVFGRVAGGQTNLAFGNYQENTITTTVTY